MKRGLPDLPSALLIVDVQVRFMPSADVSKQVGVINRVSAAYRRAGRPVVLMRVMGEVEGHPYDGPRSDLFAEGLIVGDNDTMVDKIAMNSFRDTPLKQILDDMGVRSVMICGSLSHMCVMGTYFGAFDAGFSPYVIEGALISGVEEYDRAAETICRCVDPDELIASLGSSPEP